MKKYFSIYKNWRNYVLFAIFTVSLFFLFSDTNNTLMLLLTKTFALVGFAAFYKLFKHWDSLGKIKELADLAIEED
ncbi:hypothetical protein ABVC71_09410 [Prevotella amnii]|uniref:hypothetical protein n=1 Tax=Prevotella amnii TaxID=419005 RepID=UPI003369FEC8